jgi:hypothetical protein
MRTHRVSVLLTGLFTLLAVWGGDPARAWAQAEAERPPTAPATDPGLLAEPRLLSKSIAWIDNVGRRDTGERKTGFYPNFEHMVTGAGWIAAGPGYRTPLFGGRAVADVSAALSWRAYKMARGRLEVPGLADDRLTVGAQAVWQDLTQVHYYGIGPDSVDTNVSDYRLQATDATAFATWYLHWKLGVSGGVGLISRPSVSSSTGFFDRGEPDTTLVHPADPAVTLARQPGYVHGDLSVFSDTRDHPRYPTHGGLYRIAVTGYRDRGDGHFGFTRWDVEAAQFVPVARRRGVIALRWWVVMSQVGDGHDIPFYLMPALGGSNTIRGYANYRFHDRHLLVVNAESRWAVFPHMDAAVFVDAGSVAARVRDLDVDRTSYGFGFRLHTHQSTLARFDVAHSTEGWRLMLKLSDVLRLARNERRASAFPFVP